MALTLVFTLAEENYGLEIDAIQEVVEDPVVHYVPQAEGVLLGSINFHGRILSLIDLPALLGFDDEKRDHRRVVLTPEYQSLVLTVSSVKRIVKLDLSLLRPSPGADARNAVRGVLDLDGVLINMLDLEEVLAQLRVIYHD
ncbi:MAG: chemotaxis protein CheW [Desulfuromonadales bacterium]|nr:chemotaxis protein CheW [Desulfuromonadales bacterium]